MFIPHDTYVCSLCLYICIISSFAKETYDNTYVYCVLMFMSDGTYVQTCLCLMIHMCARCVCTYASPALLQKRPMMIHLFDVCSCLCLMVHMYHHRSLLQKSWWYRCIIRRAWCLHICTIRHKHEHTINICIIIGLFGKRADDTYVQTQGAWWYTRTDTASTHMYHQT